MSVRIQQAIHAAQKQRDHEAGLALQSIFNDTFSIEQLHVDLESEVFMYTTLCETLEALDANPALESVFEVPANPYLQTYSMEAEGASGRVKEVANAVWEKIKEIFAKIKAFFKALFAKIMGFFSQMKFETLSWWDPKLVVEMDISSETVSYLRGAVNGKSIDLKPAIGRAAFEAHLKKLDRLQGAARSLTATATGILVTPNALVRETAEIAKQWDGCTIQIGPWSIHRTLNAEGTPKTIRELEQAMHQTTVAEVHDHAKSVNLAVRLDAVKAMEKDLQQSQYVTGFMKRLTNDLDASEEAMRQLGLANSKNVMATQICLQSASLIAKVSRAVAGDIQKYAQVVQKGYDVYRVAVRNAKFSMKADPNEPVDAKFRVKAANGPVDAGTGAAAAAAA